MQLCFLTAVAVGVPVIPHCSLLLFTTLVLSCCSQFPAVTPVFLISAVFSVVPSGVPYCCSCSCSLLFFSTVSLLLLSAVVSFNSFVCWPSANWLTNSAEIPGVISLSHKLQVFVFLPTGIWPVNICRTGPTTPIRERGAGVETVPQNLRQEILLPYRPDLPCTSRLISGKIRPLWGCHQAEHYIKQIANTRGVLRSNNSPNRSHVKPLTNFFKILPFYACR